MGRSAHSVAEPQAAHAMRHTRSLSTRRRLVAVLAAVGVLAVGGAAWAYFTSSGSGSAHASTGTMSTVTLNAAAGTPSTPLYPGRTGDVSLEVNNPNAYAVTLVSVAGNGTITPDAGHSGCTTTGVTFTNQTGLTTTIPGSASNQTNPPAGRGVDELLVVERLPGCDLLHPRHDHGGEAMRLSAGSGSMHVEARQDAPTFCVTGLGGGAWACSRPRGRTGFRLLGDHRQLQPGGGVGHELVGAERQRGRGVGDFGEHQLDGRQPASGN